MSLEAEAAAWAQEHGEAVPPTPPPDTSSSSSSSSSAPPSSPAPQPEPAAQEEPKRSRAEQRESNQVIAAFAVGLLDVLACKFVGPRMKLSADETAQLVTLAEPVVEKYFPDIDAGPEEMLLGGLLIVYAPKYFTSEPPKHVPSPAGGKDEPKASSGTPTEASVDGRAVNAQVLQ